MDDYTTLPGALAAADRIAQGPEPSFGTLAVREIVTTLAAEVRRQKTLLDSPEVKSFAKGVMLEALHQRQRWGTEHDSGKEPQDWFWLIGYLAGKALRAAIDGDQDKALHHCVSAAAVCCNWHASISGSSVAMRPGIEQPQDADRAAA